MNRILFLFAVAAAAWPVFAQQTSAEKAKAVLAAEKARAAAASLEQAGSSRANLERIRKENERRVANSQITPKEHAAIKTLLDDVDKDSLSDDQRKARIADFLKDAAPQVREMFLTKTDAAATPAKPVPAAPAAVGKPAPPVSFSNIPVPPPKDPKARAPKKKTPTPLTIDADELLFRQDSKVAVFKGSVKLRSLQMDIDCQELEVLFKDKAFESQPQDAAPAAGGAKPGAAPDAGKPPEKPAGSTFDPTKPVKPAEGAGTETKTEEDKIEKAWARGRGSLVTIVRRSPQKVTVCKCGEAIFESKTGNLTLKQSPEIQEGGKAIYALDPGTILILDKEGTLQANGRVGTRAVEDKPSKPAPPAAAPAPTAGKPAPPAAKPNS